MARINPISTAEADEKTASTLKAVEKKMGGLPNIFTTFAVSPVALQAYLSFVDAMGKGKLSPRQRELIAIAVAHANGCDYCLSAHNAIGKGIGLEDKDVLQAMKGNALNGRDREIIHFALQVLHARGGVIDRDISSMRATFGSDEIIIEVVANVVLNIFTNYLNLVADTDVDFPAVNFEPAA